MDYSLPVGTIYRHYFLEGEIGLEIEVEGKNLPSVSKVNATKFWCHHIDNSLRGLENGEYVLKEPIKMEDVPHAINEIRQLLKLSSSELDDSNRTSVHVHFNVQKFHPRRLVAFSALYFMVENLLTSVCGQHREGNLFCLRAEDAPGIISQIKNYILSGFCSDVSTSLHYSGFNIESVPKLGSVEIRTFRGPYSLECFSDIERWVRLLYTLYKGSEKYDNPQEIVQNFSGKGGFQTFLDVFGDRADDFMIWLGKSSYQISTEMLSGIRMIQRLVYARDWLEIKELTPEHDVFQRVTFKEFPDTPGNRVIDALKSAKMNGTKALKLLEATKKKGNKNEGTVISIDELMAGPETTTFEEEEEEFFEED